METQIQEPPKATIDEKEVKPVNYIMNIIGSDGTPTRDSVQFTQVKRLGGGNMGNVYLAKTTYSPKGVILPETVAVKVASAGKENSNRGAVRNLTRLRGAAGRMRPGMMAFPIVYAVDDQPSGKPYSYAMETIDSEKYGGIYTAMGNVNSLVTMLTVYSDAVEIMIDAGIAQNDRKMTDIVWFEKGQKLKILDWDTQIFSRVGEARVVSDEMFRLSNIIGGFLNMVRGPDGKFLTEEQIGDMAVLQKSLPQPVFELVRLVMQKELPENRESLDEIKFKALMLREGIKDAARDLITYQLTDLQDRQKTIAEYIQYQQVSNRLPKSLIEAAGRSKDEANSVAIWEAARTEMAIYLKARDYLQSIRMEIPNEFDEELARILDERSGHTLTWEQIISAIRENNGLDPLKDTPKITSFDPSSVDNEVLWHLYRMNYKRRQEETAS